MFSSLTTPPTTLFKHHNTPFLALLQQSLLVTTTESKFYFHVPTYSHFGILYVIVILACRLWVLRFISVVTMCEEITIWWNTIYIQSSALQSGNAVGHRDTKWRHRDAGPRIGDVGTRHTVCVQCEHWAVCVSKNPISDVSNKFSPCVGSSGRFLAVRA